METMNNGETVQANETMEQTIARLTAENAALKAAPAKKLGLKVSEKGALSLYGLGRFPITLYRGQWEKIFAMVEDIKAFIKANEATLTVKQ